MATRLAHNRSALFPVCPDLAGSHRENGRFSADLCQAAVQQPAAWTDVKCRPAKCWLQLHLRFAVRWPSGRRRRFA